MSNPFDLDLDLGVDPQAMRDAMQDLRDDTQDARLRQLDAIQLEPGEAASTPAAHEPSASQRLRIHVPHVRSTLWLGASAATPRDGDGGPPNYEGFGVFTKGCSYVHAEGEASYQSKRDTTIYAYGDGANLLAGAKNNIALASGGNTLVQGAVAWSSPAA